MTDLTRDECKTFEELGREMGLTLSVTPLREAERIWSTYKKVAKSNQAKKVFYQSAEAARKEYKRG